MNRTAIIISACVLVVGGVVFALASAAGGKADTSPRSMCNFSVTMPVSDIPASSQTNSSPPIK